MRERGVQSRRARAAEPGSNPAGPPPGGGPGFWPAIAIIAVIVATAGWTTVGVLVVNGPAASASTPAPSDDPGAEEDPIDGEEPIEESHAVPALEALLPAQAGETPLTRESYTGDGVLVDDNWSLSVTAFLTSVGKTAIDLQAAQAYDPDGTIDLNSVWAFRVEGVEPDALRDAMIEAWKTDYPELTTSPATIAGKSVTRGSFGEDSVDSFWYVHDGTVFDVETGDEALAASILAGLPPASAPAPSAPVTESAAPTASAPS